MSPSVDIIRIRRAYFDEEGETTQFRVRSTRSLLQSACVSVRIGKDDVTDWNLDFVNVRY